MMDVYLVGVGMTKFGRLQEHSVKDIAAGAVGAASVSYTHLTLPTKA